ncbi:hypothetical protein K439DRAFT_1652376 [Ramaria rubella]|nr:hypothetical protein K439DRAFT_1652376 [Ramaria rubella]
MSAMSGLPLLSYPPPEPVESDESVCRKCNREFNFLFSRQKRCNHCGYAYCSTCADYRALMPRAGQETGYEVLSICAYCVDMLTITGSSKSKLRDLPLSKLRSYMKAYNVRLSGAALEKDDLVEAILRAKGSNGCLLPVHEEFYRKNSVPRGSNDRSRRSFFSRASQQDAPTPTAQPQQPQYTPPPGPPPQPHYTPPSGPPRQPYYTPPSGSPPHQHHSTSPPRSSPPFQRYHPVPSDPLRSSTGTRPPRHQPQHPPTTASPPTPQQFYHPPTSRSSRSSQPYPSQARQQSPPHIFRPSTSQTNLHSRPPGANPPEDQWQTRQPPPRPRSAAPTVPTSPPAPPPPLPVPSLEALLERRPEEIASLPISTLKSILFENRVNSSSGVLEKQDLVQKVLVLVKDERRDREYKEREAREEAERMMWARREREREEEDRMERERKLTEQRQRNAEELAEGKEGKSTGVKARPTSSPTPYSDRTQDGLCVVCQDEHANMAIIDCGHLALCKSCSEMVMKSSRECPLCRTRIVTEQRLLRIFKT